MNSAAQLRAMLSTGDVLRYHTEHRAMIQAQTTSQHAYGVVCVLYYLTDGRISRELLLAGLWHDAGERWIGDIPSPVKRNFPELGQAVDKAEADALFKHTGIALPELTEAEAVLLRLADGLEGLWFSYYELNHLGNKAFSTIFGRYYTYVRKMINESWALLTPEQRGRALDFMTFEQGEAENEES